MFYRVDKGWQATRDTTFEDLPFAARAGNEAKAEKDKRRFEEELASRKLEEPFSLFFVPNEIIIFDEGDVRSRSGKVSTEMLSQARQTNFLRFAFLETLTTTGFLRLQGCFPLLVQGRRRRRKGWAGEEEKRNNSTST